MVLTETIKEFLNNYFLFFLVVGVVILFFLIKGIIAAVKKKGKIK